MWAAVFPFLLGALTALIGVVFLLFRWDPTATVEDIMRKRRLPPVLVAGGPNAWELQQRARLLPPLGVQEETCLWLNSLAGYCFAFLSEKLNAAAADGRLEAHINGTLRKKKFPDFVVSGATTTSRAERQKERTKRKERQLSCFIVCCVSALLWL